MTSTAAALLQDRLGLSDEELLAVLDASPLAVVGGDLDHKPELPVLLALTAEPAERVGPGVLRRWLRARGPPAGRSTTCWPGTSAPSRTTSTRSPSGASSYAAAARWR